MLALLQGVSRSFYVSIRLLPGPLRRPIAVAYLLARACDTVADTADLATAPRRDMLDTLAAAIDGRVGAQEAAAQAERFAPLQRDPRERALIESFGHCLQWLHELGPEDASDVRAVLRSIARGQALDIERFAPGLPPRALATAPQLDEYTYLVAGCVGEFWTDLCFRHFPGFANRPRQEMRELGRAYGMGLQLVNIVRDAGEDLALGRCYFPADELAAIGVDTTELKDDPARLGEVWARWHAQAGRQVALGMRYADAVASRRVRAASAMPALLAARTLALLGETGPQRAPHKVKVPRSEVRAMMARLAWTFAGRAPMQALYARLSVPGPRGGWDNPPP